CRRFGARSGPRRPRNIVPEIAHTQGNGSWNVGRGSWCLVVKAERGRSTHAYVILVRDREAALRRFANPAELGGRRDAEKPRLHAASSPSYLASGGTSCRARNRTAWRSRTRRSVLATDGRWFW